MESKSKTNNEEDNFFESNLGSKIKSIRSATTNLKNKIMKPKDGDSLRKS